jgi:hypothetical protein
MLGNLGMDEIEERLGIVFPSEIKQFMENNRQMDASNIQKGKWHCFDIPFIIVFGDIETGKKVYEALKPFASECKKALEFCIAEKNRGKK